MKKKNILDFVSPVNAVCQVGINGVVKHRFAHLEFRL